MSTKTKQHLAALTFKIDQQVDLTASGVKSERQFIEVWKEIPQEIQQQVQQQLEKVQEQLADDDIGPIL